VEEPTQKCVSRIGLSGSESNSSPSVTLKLSMNLNLPKVDSESQGHLLGTFQAAMGSP